MQTNIYVSWSTSELRVRLAPWNWFKPSSKIFYWIFQGGTAFVDIFFSVLCLLCLRVRLFICALWSPSGKGLTSWLSFVVYNCECVTFPLVSWVRCGTWLYKFLIFALLLTSTVGFLLLQHLVVCTLESLSLFYLLLITDLYVLGDVASMSQGSFMRTKHLCVLIYIRIKGEVGTVKSV